MARKHRVRPPFQPPYAPCARRGVKRRARGLTRAGTD